MDSFNNNNKNKYLLSWNNDLQIKIKVNEDKILEISSDLKSLDVQNNIYKNEINILEKTMDNTLNNVEKQIDNYSNNIIKKIINMKNSNETDRGEKLFTLYDELHQGPIDFFSKKDFKYEKSFLDMVITTNPKTFQHYLTNLFTRENDISNNDNWADILIPIETLKQMYNDMKIKYKNINISYENLQIKYQSKKKIYENLICENNNIKQEIKALKDFSSNLKTNI